MPFLQLELKDLRVRTAMLEEQLQAATEANDSLLAEWEHWAEQGRLYEQSVTELSRITDRVAELEG